MSNQYPQPENTRRPLSTPHLVFGIVFTGIAAVRFIGEATHADLPRSAIGFPIVLIGAGIVGLIATVHNARRRRQAWLAERSAVADQYGSVQETSSTDTEPTKVIESEQS